jgi:hypothetical protein
LKSLLIVLTALSVVAAATAATPTKNGLYSAKLTGKGLEKKVELHVAPSGKTATAALYCSNTLSGKIPTFPIKAGAFAAKDKFNTFGLKGRFSTAKTAAATLHLQGICDRAAPGNFKLQLKLSSS